MLGSGALHFSLVLAEVARVAVSMRFGNYDVGRLWLEQRVR